MKGSSKSRACVFCGGTPVSREHLFPNWIDKAVQARFPGREYDYPTSVRGGPEYIDVKFDSVVNRACEPCNNGWMSMLEARTRPLLEPTMFLEHSVVLTPDDQRMLATWVWKTALMANFVLPDADQVMDPQLYPGLFAEQLPPSRVTIWTAAVGARELVLQTKVGRAEVEMNHTYNRDGILVRGLGTGTASVCFLRIFQALFLVNVSSGVHIPMHHRLEGRVAIRIWPPHSDTVIWPLNRNILDEESAERFSRPESFRSSSPMPDQA